MANVSKRYNKKWSELTPAERAKSGSKAEHSAKRESAGLKGTSAAASAKAKAQAQQTKPSSSTPASATKTHQQKMQEYNDFVPGWGEQYRKDKEPNPGRTWGDTHTVTFGDDGKIDMDPYKQQLFNRDKLFDLGFSEGSNIYRGGEDAKGRYGTGLMGAGGLQVQQSDISGHFLGGSSYNPQVARLLDSGQLTLDENSGAWSSYDKKGNMLHSGTIDATRDRYGYTHESAGAVRDEFKYADHHYNSESNKNIRNQASEFTKQQQVRDKEAREAEILRGQQGGKPNFDGAWTNPRANELYRETGGEYEYNPSAYDNNPDNVQSGTSKSSEALSNEMKKATQGFNHEYSFDMRSAGSSKRNLNLGYTLDPSRFNQGQ